MSDYVEPADDLSHAWLRTLDLVHDHGGRRTNVMTTVRDPLASEDPIIRAAIDSVLAPGKRAGVTIQEVDTVAGTIFPQDLYISPDFAWSPDLDPDREAELDTAANDLYGAYSDMLPLLCTASGNQRGTYFGRMISWPGKKPGGLNQLALRVQYLRAAHRAGYSSHNTSDITIGGQAETASMVEGDLGVQIYASTDRRLRGFPCLVHIDLTLLDGELSMLAVYRHQYLVTKAYGNLLGLARLLAFLAQQTGFAIGELAVQATLADTETATYGGRRGIDELIELAQQSAPVDAP
ncbi:hypothetical protein [Saccharothrix deserti]|uniref:hypothetical protein n=1 Tax=Saccharothrix deserti TaxID=2593674 RepID=UPI00131DB3D0|nr:hypothetical protein [Saccharothrix deserti]